MFQFGRYRFHHLFIQLWMMGVYSHRVPPFGFLRVNAFSSSPKLFAGLRVLLRLSMPRHPPAALNSLTTNKILMASLTIFLAFSEDLILKRHF